MKLNKKEFNQLSKIKRWIIEALLTLMENDEYSKITITQIAQEAEIARATFYLNFKTKDDIIRCYVQTLIIQYRKDMEEKNLETPYLLAKTFFNYWGKNIELLYLLEQHNLFFMLLEEFNIFMNQLSCSKDPSITFNIPHLSSKDLMYFNAFNSAGLWNLLEKWVKNNADKTPKEMAKLYSIFVGYEYQK